MVSSAIQRRGSQSPCATSKMTSARRTHSRVQCEGCASVKYTTNSFARSSRWNQWLVRSVACAPEMSSDLPKPRRQASSSAPNCAAASLVS